MGVPSSKSTGVFRLLVMGHTAAVDLLERCSIVLAISLRVSAHKLNKSSLKRANKIEANCLDASPTVNLISLCSTWDLMQLTGRDGSAAALGSLLGSPRIAPGSTWLETSFDGYCCCFA